MPVVLRPLLVAALAALAAGCASVEAPLAPEPSADEATPPPDAVGPDRAAPDGGAADEDAIEPPAATTVELVALEDATVCSGDVATPPCASGSTHEGEPQLHVDATPIVFHTFLKFDLSGVSGSITRARLRLSVPDAVSAPGAASVAGGDVRRVVDTAWTAGTLSFAAAPAADAVAIGDIGATSVSTRVEIELSPEALTAGVEAALALLPVGNDGSDYFSLEGAPTAADRPTLLLEVTPAP